MEPQSIPYEASLFSPFKSQLDLNTNVLLSRKPKAGDQSKGIPTRWQHRLKPVDTAAFRASSEDDTHWRTWRSFMLMTFIDLCEVLPTDGVTGGS